MFVKIKILFCIKVFLLMNQKQNVPISSSWEKTPTQKSQKQSYINWVRGEEMRKEKEEKH